jgi:hypothetical protein
MKPEYNEGPKALEKFNSGMANLFKAQKPTAKQPDVVPKPKPKRKKASKG